MDPCIEPSHGPAAGTDHPSAAYRYSRTSTVVGLVNDALSLLFAVAILVGLASRATLLCLAPASTLELKARLLKSATQNVGRNQDKAIHFPTIGDLKACVGAVVCLQSRSLAEHVREKGADL